MTAPAYRIDGQPCSAEAFYAAACDPSRSVVVEACAGAGKTWMLVSRILRALLDGAEPRQILAITFTRKAAGEMRERLTQWLQEFSRADDAARVLALRQRGLSQARAEELAPRLGALHGELLAAGRAVEIRTFHGWFSQLLRAAPLVLLNELGVSPGADLVEDTEELEPELFRRFHQKVRSDEALRHDFVEQVLLRGRSRVRQWLVAAWQRRVEFEAADAAGTLEESVAPASALWPEFVSFEDPRQRLRSVPVRSLLGAVAQSLGAHRNASVRTQAELLQQALSNEDLPAAFTAAWHALFTAEDTPRKKLEAPDLERAIQVLQEIRRAYRQQSAREEHLRMVRLARVLLAEYAALKRRRGLVDMPDLESCALHLLRDASLSGWVQERLDQRIRHVLVDEFQDTSPLQWHALHGWLASYAGAGGGASGQRPPSVFVVGDPKQSIYRFRGAEPRVFLAARDFVAEALGGSVLECDHTRRNAPEVLQAVNEVFLSAQAAGAYGGFRPHTTDAAAGAPGVEALPRIARPPRAPKDVPQDWRDSLTTPRHEPEEGLRQKEARQVASAVKSLLAQGLRPDDVFVLARKRAPLREAALALQAEGVPHVAPEENLMMAAPEVRDLVAAMDVLASPGHDLSLAQALRSPLFGCSDEDLLWLAGRAGGARWWPALMAGAAEAPQVLRRAAALFKGWAAAQQTLPPHDLLDRIVDESGFIPSMLQAVPPARRAAAVHAVQSLLALALQLDGARYASLYGFVRSLRRRALKMPLGAQAGAVQLLTVHGAKGLEARAVVLVDADAAPAKAETCTLLVDWPVDEPAPRACAFIASESGAPAQWQPSIDGERLERAREELNGLYVAMTRARQALLLSAIEPYGKGDEGSWWARVSPLARELRLDQVPAGPLPAGREEAPSAAAGSLRWLALPEWKAPAAAAPAMPAARSEISRRGEAFHRLLEWAAGSPGQPLGALAVAAARAFDLPEDAHETLLQQAKAVLEAPQLRRFFDPQALAWAGNEVSLVDEAGLVRLDRLVALLEGGQRVWWVIDYKLQSAPAEVAAYREQLARYRRLVQRLQPGEEVRAAFVTAGGRLIEA